jgi:predicted nuclease of restriction endonuclease-like (RecB) superfamily
MNFLELQNKVEEVHQTVANYAVKQVNFALTIRNWLIGFYIVEYEQSGNDRAKYGENLLITLAKELKLRGLKGFSDRSLRQYRQFYITYPQIWQTVSAKLKVIGFNTDESLFNKQLTYENDELMLPIDTLVGQLSFSHFIELLRLDTDLKRRFYEVEAVKNNWSVRELERAIDTLLFERTGLSKNKHAVIKKIKDGQSTQSLDIIKNPYILEFLGIEEKPEYTESDLETAIINHLQQFLTELGRGFCFEARQKRITFDNTHYRIDLVFYHRILKCHVLIDLKLGKFSHADSGQMNLYLNYFKKNEMVDGDNQPIGIILCADKDESLVEFALGGLSNEIFVSEYLLQLPDKKLLQEFISKELK